MDDENPFADRRVRSVLGLFSATMIAIVAIVFLDGMIRWAMLAFAAFDLVMTPYMLGLVARQSDDEDPSGFEN